MAVEMGADQPIVLDPRCPATKDPEIQGFLRLVTALTGALWVELELCPNGPAPSQSYLSGPGGGKAVTLALDVGVGFEASLRLGKTVMPPAELAALLSGSLRRVLELRSLMIQVELLRGALDSTSSTVLLFDRDGGILFANPPADRLLSLQTEDELLAGCNDQPLQPLFTLLSSLVEEVAADDGAASTWKGGIELEGGRMMACEVARLAGPSGDGPQAVLVIMQPEQSESASRLQLFSSSHGLSPREQEVLRLLGRGLTTAAMAEELSISPHTVRDHLKHLYRKTGTKGRSELLGLISRVSGAAGEA
jgi:DNA-binding CsgD family transcriptional regulator